MSITSTVLTNIINVPMTLKVSVDTDHVYGGVMSLMDEGDLREMVVAVIQGFLVGANRGNSWALYEIVESND